MTDQSPGPEGPLAAVIFDYGGVLRGDGREVWAAADAAADLAPGTLWAAWHEIPQYRLARQGTISGAAFRMAVRQALTAMAGDGERAETALATLEVRLASLPPVDVDMQRLVERLRRARRVKLGLLSNASRGWSERFHALGVAHLFDDIVVSADVGLAKPDVAIFHLAADRLGVAPPACLVVDDQPQHVEAARAAGLRGHLHEPARLGDLIARLGAEGALDGERRRP